MVRSYCKLFSLAALIVLGGAALCAPSFALTLLSPTEGQAVRENVKIQIPANALPDSGFISVLVGKGSERKFVVSLGRDMAKESRGVFTFYWNSKGPYYDSRDPKTLKYFKDGSYPVTIQVHGAEGNMIEAATVNVTIKNKIAKPNPAPAVAMVNKLPFGQTSTYGIHADVEIFNAVNLPVLGGYSTTCDFKLIQSVEDVRSAGELLLRYRLDENSSISYRGMKTILYDGEPIKPQLYRLVTKYGKVINPNLFTKQARYTLMDVLPVLPTRGVRDGDSWQDQFTLKLEGLTSPIKMTGNSRLDSFEWQDAHECAKIVSDLTGQGQISLVDGKVISAGPIKAHVVTYFAYKSGRMLRREIELDFPAAILPGAGQSDLTGQPGEAPPPSASPYNDEGPGAPGYADPAVSAMPPGMNPNDTPGSSSPKYSRAGQKRDSYDKGSVRINVVVRLEK